MTASQDYLDQPPTKKSKGKAVVGSVAAIAGLLVGVGIGISDNERVEVPGPTKTVTAEAKPAPTVTVTPEPEVKIETKEVPVEVTPQSCLVFIGLADEAFTIIGEALQGQRDMYQAEQDIVDMTPMIHAARAECQASAPAGS